MPAIRRDDDEGAVRWPTLSEIFVTKSLLSWVWENVINRRGPVPSAHANLMPPEGFENFEWTSNTAIARTSNEVCRTSSQWFILLLAILTTIVGACMLQRLAKLFVRLWKMTVVCNVRRAPAPVTCEKTPVVRACDVPKKTKCRAASSEDGKLAISPIQELFNPRTKHDPATKQLMSAQTTRFEAVHISRTVDRKMLADLSLSEIILTINIPPSLPIQDEDDAIVELSEMLRRW
ncbi:uncharacterized protein M421DRAFT_224689 [Didymella exigua CBS 183.55]|uniref:Uncharacterized protein n=1 Tax=Didymella exigua CBS 183.55 TaxID=1150837 RepID=A0A6A5RCX6_9PLEO|nr:uncharacterized protein M421DRAFT_224689 [Didymella exigua CBS 183.55]KAF1926091.1 hypothetical protein M421DRAFT_224689 [Didymella exigua CBS 183.55]